MAIDGDSTASKPPWFQPRRRAASDRLCGVVKAATARLDARAKDKPGARAVLTTDSEQAVQLTLQVQAVIADVVWARINGHTGVHIRGTKAAYRKDGPVYQPPVSTSGLPAIVNRMWAAGIIEKVKAGKRGRSVNVWGVGSWLGTALAHARVSASDFILADLEPTEPLIWLRPAKDRTLPWPKRKTPARAPADLPETDDRVKDMRELNEWLAGLNIALWPVEAGSDAAAPFPWDVADRKTVRIFNGGDAALRLGGRIYGAYQQVPRCDRWRIKLAGQPIVEIDARAMLVRLAFAYVRAEMPEGDPYLVPELLDAGLTRDAIKKLTISRLFDNDTANRSRLRYPKLEDGEARDLFRKTKLKAPEAIRILEEHHWQLADGRIWGAGKGLELMFHESEWLMRVLSACRDAALPCLPLFDCLLVPLDRFPEAGDLMDKAFGEYVAATWGLEDQHLTLKLKLPLSPSEHRALSDLQASQILPHFSLPHIDLPNVGPDTIMALRRDKEGWHHDGGVEWPWRLPSPVAPERKDRPRKRAQDYNHYRQVQLSPDRKKTAEAILTAYWADADEWRAWFDECRSVGLTLPPTSSDVETVIASLPLVERVLRAMSVRFGNPRVKTQGAPEAWLRELIWGAVRTWTLTQVRDADAALADMRMPGWSRAVFKME